MNTKYGEVRVNYLMPNRKNAIEFGIFMPIPAEAITNNINTAGKIDDPINQNSTQNKKETTGPEIIISQAEAEQPEPVEPITPEDAKKIKWYSSNTSVGEKTTPEGKKIYGLSLTTNPEYAQSYSKTKEVNIFDLSSVNLKPVSFDYGMTIDEKKRTQILKEGFDGIIFNGAGDNPEIALLTPSAILEGQITPIPKGIKLWVKLHKSIPEKVVQDYKINMPEGYTIKNGRYVFKQ
jgi:hypothetical protein